VKHDFLEKYNEALVRIGLISDTHIPDTSEKIPERVSTLFCGVDLILHGGDIYSPSVLEDLESLAPVLAATGDDDWIAGDLRVQEKHVLQLEGFTIWLIHQFMPLTFYSKGLLSIKDTQAEIKGQHVLPDILIFGHTHKPLYLEIENTLFINPGSATWPAYVPGLGTVAILTLSSGKAEVETFQLTKG
jgi:uncharacterized protein